MSSPARLRHLISIQKDIERRRRASINHKIVSEVQQKGGFFKDYDLESGMRKSLPSSLKQLTPFERSQAENLQVPTNKKNPISNRRRSNDKEAWPLINQKRK